MSECEDEKRAFIIDNSTVLKNKILILNEYGFEFGQLNYENELSAEGFIQIENKELKYVIYILSLARVILYNEYFTSPRESLYSPGKVCNRFFP